jgi:hypothetical protein
MAIALMNSFDANIIQNVLAFVPKDEPEIYSIYGATQIFNKKHYITYGGGPEGGFVYITASRKPGWYRWHRDWYKKPQYTRVTKGQVAFLINADGSEEIAVIPEGYDDEDLFDLAETVIIADADYMEELEGL